MYVNKPPGNGDTAALVQMIKESVKKELRGELQARQQYNLTSGIRHWEMIGSAWGAELDYPKTAGGAWKAGPVHPQTEEGVWEGAPVCPQTGGRPGIPNDFDLQNMLGALLGRPNVASYADQMFDDYEGEAEPWWAAGPFADPGKGLLYGAGTVLFLGLLFPAFGRKLQAVFTRTAAEGMELFNKARSLAARAKEDIEDLIAEANLEGLMKRPRP